MAGSSDQSPTPWSQGHAAKVTEIAHRTELSHVNGLGAVAFDTFIVGSKTRIPGPGLWRAVNYREADWHRVFSGALMLHGTARAPWESSMSG